MTGGATWCTRRLLRLTADARYCWHRRGDVYGPVTTAAMMTTACRFVVVDVSGSWWWRLHWNRIDFDKLYARRRAPSPADGRWRRNDWLTVATCVYRVTGQDDYRLTGSAISCSLSPCRVSRWPNAAVSPLLTWHRECRKQKWRWLRMLMELPIDRLVVEETACVHTDPVRCSAVHRYQPIDHSEHFYEQS